MIATADLCCHLYAIATRAHPGVVDVERQSLGLCPSAAAYLELHGDGSPTVSSIGREAVQLCSPV